MNEFRQNLVREFIGPLGDLYARISNGYSNELREDSFRLIHSVKGCSRTFGLRQSAEIAADIERLLVEGKSGETSQNLILERLALLIDTLKRPRAVRGKSDFRPDSGFDAERTICFCRISAPLYGQLTESEKSVLVAALSSGREVFTVRRAIGNATFADDFRRFRADVGSSGEIIAILPETGALEPLSGIVFLVATGTGSPIPEGGLERINVEIDDEQYGQLLEGVADHIARVASEAGKAVAVTLVADDLSLGAGRSKPIFEILIHLASNSVDHGIESTGRIEITLLRDGDSIVVTFADNGRGIDLENAESRAERIFEPGFSSGDGANSGQGYGLFIVSTEVLRMNGKISFETRKGSGTRFEIRLPR
jgi:anti-sigma regulatory factor (Ser/Thr protein kinase)/HPt (histidine-containing phosphotransfer) domain-containing protein